MSFVIVDTFFVCVKMVSFMADLRMKYICRPAVALVDMTLLLH